MPSYKKIINKLIKRNITISVAESCSGGQLSSTITKVSGVSKIFNMGIITYSNQAKSSLLKVPLTKITKHGSVSEEVALSMVMNLAKLSKSEICISTTGISGPSGGSKKKPVGLVYIGIKFNKKVFVVRKIFIGDRKKIQNDTVNYALKIIKDLI
ncbi:CinA family protein [Alphaproteobacteria bacterium]|nr:CinA family protein [Alphaproteobacteria bacterium]